METSDQAPARPIYLDGHATTPLDPRVLEEMLPCLREEFGNPSSRSHAYGWRAEALVERARERVAALIGADPVEIVFTSGATESDNLAVKGAARAMRSKGDEVLVGATEHHAVLEPARALVREGFRVGILPVEPDGRIAPETLAAAITPRTVLVSLMWANNEIGAIHPIAELGEICRECGVLFHSDAVQAAAWLPIDVSRDPVDLLSLSAHKMCGPKGVGALYLRRKSPRARVEPLFHGGGQERGLRPGTLAVPGIVGMGAAAELAMREREADAARVGALRDRLLARLREADEWLRVLGEGNDWKPGGAPDGMKHRLPSNLNVAFFGAEAEALLARVAPFVAASSSSACASASLEPSHVLKAIEADEYALRGAIRFGLTRFTTREEIETAADRIAEALGR